MQCGLIARRAFVARLFIVLSFTSTVAVAAPNFTFFELPPHSRIQPTDTLNNLGEIAILTNAVVGSDTEIFIRDSDGDIRFYSDMPQSTSIFPSQVTGFNDFGLVTGFTVDGTSRSRGFIQEPGETAVVFDMPGFNVTRPTGISNSGRVIGTAFSTTREQGFIRETDGSFTLLGSAFSRIKGTAINNLGDYTTQIGNAGRDGSFINFANGNPPVLLTIDGIAKPLITPTGINDLGAVTGFWFADEDERQAGLYRSFLRSPTGAIVNIEVPDAAPGSARVLGINNSGQVFGIFDSEIDDSSAFKGFIADIAPPPPPGSRFSVTTIPPRSEATGLIVIAHGWNSSPQAWPNDLKDLITARLTETGEIGNWDIVAYDWSEDAKLAEFPDIRGPLRFPTLAAYNAQQHGVAVGADIATSGYEKVHFIGHSAGSWLIDSAAQKLSPDVVVTSTFLDAFDSVFPGLDSSTFGTTSVWAEHYYRRHDLPFTAGELENAYNVDITALDPDPFFDWGNVPVIQRFIGHSWPHNWYRSSVNPEDPISHGWGFAVSQEEGVILNKNIYKPGPGNGTKLNKNSDPPIDFDWLTDDLSTMKWGTYYDKFGIFSKSSTGTTTTDGTKATSETSSPVWFTSLIEIEEHQDVLNFGFEFTEDSGGEGLLVIYWDEHLLGRFDERYVKDGYQEYFFELGLLGTPGIHFLSFRLDSYNDLHSKIALDNLRLGARPVPVPGGFMLLTPAVLGLGVIFRRGKCSHYS